jgi:hypothetical protein
MYPLKHLFFCDMKEFLFPYEKFGFEFYIKWNAWLRKQNMS